MNDFATDPAAAPLGFVVNPQTGYGAATGGNNPTRPTASTITDAQLDALYEEAGRLRITNRALNDAAREAMERAEKAEAERDTARQHAAAIAAQRDRLRMRMNALADRWDAALAVDKPYARALRGEISVAPFDPDGAMAVQEYTERGQHLWAFRCWGTDTCDGWLGLGHHTQTSALSEQERHVAEEHAEPTPCAGFPENCPNLRAVVPTIGSTLGGGLRCGCGDQPKES